MKEWVVSGILGILLVGGLGVGFAWLITYYMPFVIGVVVGCITVGLVFEIIGEIRDHLFG